MPSPFQNIDAPCPGCQYNLRGRIKFGGVTECPECGRGWKIDQLLLQQYAEPRFRWSYLLYALLPGVLFSGAEALRSGLRGTAMQHVGDGVYPFVTILCVVVGPFAIGFLCWGAFEQNDDVTRTSAAFITAGLMIAANIVLVMAASALL